MVRVFFLGFFLDFFFLEMNGNLLVAVVGGSAGSGRWGGYCGGCGGRVPICSWKNTVVFTEK